MKVGFIGLGIMGKPMSKNILKNGHELVVYNRSRASVDELVACGAEAASSSKEVAEKCNVIITMVPNSPQVREVCLGKDGIIEGAKEGLKTAVEILPFMVTSTDSVSNILSVPFFLISIVGLASSLFHSILVDLISFISYSLSSMNSFFKTSGVK